MLLTIDCGNTATKMALWQGDSIVRQWNEPDLPADIPGVDAAILSSVRKQAHIPAFLVALGPRFINLSSDTPLPIHIGYDTPRTLGADRIAAAVGAVRIAPPADDILVVDIGTAVTYDFITADKVFVGGNIAPGINLRLKALNQFTSHLPVVDADGDTPLLGNSTATAMRSGAVRGIAAEIEYYYSQLLRRGTSITTIVTGGSAPLVKPFISSPFIFEPGLTMTGLKTILDYNENL